MPCIIVEGVTGTGKTSTIEALRSSRESLLVNENDTFDEFMATWLRQPNLPVQKRTQRLNTVLDSVQANQEASLRPNRIIERFHLSYFALDGDWSTYQHIDDRASLLGIGLVLLDLSDEMLATRSLCREEYGEADWQGMIQLYGSESRALGALRLSQQRRRDALEKTRLQHLVIDTEAMDWPAYARMIWAWADGIIKVS